MVYEVLHTAGREGEGEVLGVAGLLLLHREGEGSTAGRIHLGACACILLVRLSMFMFTS